MKKLLKNIIRIILFTINILLIFLIGSMGYFFSYITYICLLVLLTLTFFVYRNKKISLNAPSFLFITALVCASEPYSLGLKTTKISDDSNNMYLLLVSLFALPASLAGFITSLALCIKSYIDER